MLEWAVIDAVIENSKDRMRSVLLKNLCEDSQPRCWKPDFTPLRRHTTEPSLCAILYTA